MKIIELTRDLTTKIETANNTAERRAVIQTWLLSTIGNLDEETEDDDTPSCSKQTSSVRSNYW